MTPNAADAAEQRTRSRLSTFTSFVRRFLLDLVVVGTWVGFLTVVFLASGGPRWAFYTLLLLGVFAYTMATGVRSNR